MKTKENRRGHGGHRGVDLLNQLPKVPVDGRELKPYAEPVTPRSLRKDQVYFAVTFADENLLIPIVETLVFVGKNLAADDDESYYFQEIYPHGRGVKYSLAGQRRGDFQVYSGSAINAIFDYDEALNQLMLCSVRRKQKALGKNI